PIVNGCLKWALANPDLATSGVWAATTAPERNELRGQLVERLGDDWVGALAEQECCRRERRYTARAAAPTVREQVLARLELELIPNRPEPYEPWREPMTPARQRSCVGRDRVPRRSYRFTPGLGLRLVSRCGDLWCPFSCMGCVTEITLKWGWCASWNDR
ncbi:hypothetical protein ACFXP3_36040, partial [Streptomyces sp. NPDC059096]